MIRELTVTEINCVSGAGFFNNVLHSLSGLGLGTGIGLTVVGGIAGLGGAAVSVLGATAAAVSLFVPGIGLPVTAVGGVAALGGGVVSAIGFGAMAVGIGLTVASGIGLGDGKPATAKPTTPAAATAH